jgi:UPF0716 protein FxsA
MPILLLLFIVLPAAELMLLIEIGTRIGTVPTLALIVVTGILGASLARWQGMGVLRKITAQTQQGQLPASHLVDGLLILLAGAVLLTPGVITDLVGFLCLVPVTRNWIKKYVSNRFRSAIQRGTLKVYTAGGDRSEAGFGRHGADEDGPVIDVTPKDPGESDTPG